MPSAEAAAAAPRWRAVNRLALYAFTLTLAVAAHLRQLAGGGADGLPLDSDGWVRLLRVRALWQGEGWYAGLLPYLSAPDGLSVHWTRPLDVMMLAPAWIAVAFGHATPDEALIWSGALICPVLHALTALAAAWAARIAWPALPVAPYYAVLILFSSDILTSYSALGRADHHTLVVLTAVLGLGWALRAARPDGTETAARIAGAVFGFGIWVSPETLLVALPVLAAFGAGWLLLRAGEAMARQGWHMAVAMGGAVAIAVAVDRSPAEWRLVEYDRVSIHHLLMSLLVAAVFAGAMRLSALARPWRFAAGAGLAAGAVLALVTLHPGALGASLSGADSVSASLFLPVVLEMQPLRLTDQTNIGSTLIFIGMAPAALLATTLLLWRGRRDGTWPCGLILLLALTGTLVATIAYRRFATNLAGVGAVAAAGLIGVLARSNWATWRRVVFMLAAFALLFLPAPLGERLIARAAASAEPQNSPVPRGCHARELTNWLLPLAPEGTDQRNAPIVIMTDLNQAAELAWRTRLRYVAAPYHRGGAAIADTIALFHAETPENAHAVIRDRGIAYLVLCPDTFAAGGPFARRLLAGDAPEWLERMAPPEEHQMSTAQLWRVR